MYAMEFHHRSLVPATLLPIAVLLAGCGSNNNSGGLFNLGGLTGDNRTEYRCDDDREFRVTYTDDRDRAVVEAGDRTYRLDLEDRDGSSRQYGDEGVRLTVDSDEARLRIPGGRDYTDCRES